MYSNVMCFVTEVLQDPPLRNSTSYISNIYMKNEFTKNIFTDLLLLVQANTCL